MALLERVATLIRANLNDLIEQAEDPEKMLKQVILDMENQLLQLKTQVAIAVTDHHLLLKKKKENEDAAADWRRRAELALDKQQEDLARSAVERSINFERIASSFGEQIADQAVQVDSLKSSLHKLEAKLDEARTKCDLLIAQHRRARTMARSGEVRSAFNGEANGAAFDRMNRKVQHEEAVGMAKTELGSDSIEDQFAKLEKEDEVTRILAEMKARRAG